MKKHLTMISLMAFCLLASLFIMLQKTYAGTPADTTRIAGAGRYQTAEEAAKYLSSITGTVKYDNVFVASGTNFPDALSGAVLAERMGAPIILYNPRNEEQTLRQVQSLLKDHGWVYILGGDSAIPDAMDEYLRYSDGKSYKMARLYGDNRYGTNLGILEELEGYIRNHGGDSKEAYDEMLFCSGTGYADALAASGVGRPIMIVGSSLTQDQRNYLSKYPVTKGCIIGGTAAVGEGVAAELAECLGYKPLRISGSSRYATAVAIAEHFYDSDISCVAVASGKNFPDALCAGPVVNKLGCPLLLTAPGSSETAAHYLESKKISKLVIFGGTAVLPDGSIEHLFAQNTALNIKTAPAMTYVMKTQLDWNNLNAYFQAYPISTGDGVYNRINGKSYRANPHIGIGSLRYLKMLHYNYDGDIQVGEMVVNAAIAQKTLNLFRELFDNHYRICQMRLIDDFWVGDGNESDSVSIDHNNTSSFNYRVVAGSSQLSRHALGYAIDINPLENPYVTYDAAMNPIVPHDVTAVFAGYNKKGEPTFRSDPSVNYVYWRSSSVPHVIMPGDLCDRLFKKYGFAWGGDWIVPKDYQHYEIPG